MRDIAYAFDNLVPKDVSILYNRGRRGQYSREIEKYVPSVVENVGGNNGNIKQGTKIVYQHYSRHLGYDGTLDGVV